MNKPSYKRVLGFTLIELMISIMIVGILMTIAIPSYMSSVRKGNRSEAQAALVRMASNQERFFASNSTYTTDLTDIGLAEDGITDNGHYEMSIAAGETGIGSSYVLTATAHSDMQTDDDGCDELSITSRGEKIPAPDDSLCW